VYAMEGVVLLAVWLGTAGATDHAADALRYLVMGVDGESREGGAVVIEW